MHLLLSTDDKADSFSDSLLVSYCNFSSLFLSTFVMIIFYIFSGRFFLKREELSEVRVAPTTTKYVAGTDASYMHLSDVSYSVPETSQGGLISKYL